MLATGIARNITLERRASVEIGGVTHEVAASVAIPIDDVKELELVYVDGSSDRMASTQERAPESSTTLTNNHAMVFPPEYE